MLHGDNFSHWCTCFLLPPPGHHEIFLSFFILVVYFSLHYDIKKLITHRFCIVWDLSGSSNSWSWSRQMADKSHCFLTFFSVLCTRCQQFFNDCGDPRWFDVSSDRATSGAIILWCKTCKQSILHRYFNNYFRKWSNILCWGIISLLLGPCHSHTCHS